MCFGGCTETSAGVVCAEANDNATNAFLRIKYKKRSSWLSSKVHRIKKMVRPIIELLQRQHRIPKEYTPDEKPSNMTPQYWDSEVEEMDNDANEALESRLPGPNCAVPCCCHSEDYCRMVCVPMFIPMAWAADADICLRNGGIAITSSQTAVQQAPL